MHTSLGHLGYCTNIHAGEHWVEHFAALQRAIPPLKNRLTPDAPLGLGLRLSDVASTELAAGTRVAELRQWLTETGCYVFTMNGFPFGGFHGVRVKDAVHKPDWTTPERVAYTNRLFTLLAQLQTGPLTTQPGISTSPLSYRHWFRWGDADARDAVFTQTTQNLLEVVTHLVKLEAETGLAMHLDLEPEPDGLLETADEFVRWFTDYLLPMGERHLAGEFGMSAAAAGEALRRHVQLCYDVCHFAVGYERPADVLTKLKAADLRVGKIQISAALKATFPAETEGREAIRQAFAGFNEPTYLHQVVARTQAGELVRFNDLPDALAQFSEAHAEWRSHFHVPIFVEDYGLLQSTQDDIREVLRLQAETPFTDQMEVETYTWEVLPEGLKLNLVDSIERELNWVRQVVNRSAEAERLSE
ncbi:TIM barrel protein [Rudanella paleaurantiibacter]|uniref:TIM barrel protein n=1 Tax=Rudanella paleaurantiibacter TaxID=2614655 RepID=A0A7J5U1Z5_9BACT|nr:metabolite traffic protein EboE [Rudanella paleaurantiibacter]KAB7731797.1 TIM barrel protein [Rudanella paleaurantiibacter]